MEARILLSYALAVTIAATSSRTFISCESDGFAQSQTLTKQNFSSQIRLHQHILLVVSVPWSGEARSLMREVAKLVKKKGEEFGSLNLMYLNRRDDKMLADAIGAAEETSVFYYRNSFPYKYRGKLNANKIVSSVLPHLSVVDGEIAFKQLNSQEELNAFVESTDKAVILFEFCGWSKKLMDTEKRNGTQYRFGLQGLYGKTSRISTRGMEDQKGTEGGSLKCNIENGFGGIPWLGQLSLVNENASRQETDYYQDAENVKSTDGLSCTLEEFKQFDSFFSKYVPVAREFLLSPERYRFGSVSERSFLSSFGSEGSGSWLLMVYFNGCPSCSKIIKEGDDLKSILQMDQPIVEELGADGKDLDHAVPANKPSVLLIVDRTSDSSETKRKSKEALTAFRELALRYHTSDKMGFENNLSKGSSIHSVPLYRSASGHPRLQLSPTSQNINFQDKIIMIVNEGKQTFLNNIASDLQGSSLHDILAYLLQKNKDTKLSSVAKDAGFELLSGDFDIKIADALPGEAEVENSQASVTESKEDLVRTNVELDKDSALYNDARSQPSDSSLSSEGDNEKRSFLDPNGRLLSVMPDQLLSDHGTTTLEDFKARATISEVDRVAEEQLYSQNFRGSFFFCDGNYRLVRALTGEITIPSLAIIDPEKQQHYVLPAKTDFSYSAMEGFLHRFINGSLTAHHRSDFEATRSKEGAYPPFVNMDFHEADSIPQLTANTFSDMVLGFNDSDHADAWNEDVLVLFSNGWCGFCQRIELVVREVYRALKGYMKVLNTGARSTETVFSGGSLKNSISKLPKIFLMDCTLNDCSFILKSLGQREIYPALLLFPAEKKNAVSFNGGVAVADVINFIADYGSNSQHLTGILSAAAGKGGRNQELLKDVSLATIHKDDSVAKERSNEVLLKNLAPKMTVEYARVQSQTYKAFGESTPNVGVGTILIASEKISAQPFDRSKILIVKVDQTGFEGLIYNKPISWDSLQELQPALEILKEAPLSFGGPLVKRGMPLVALTRRVVQGQYPEVAAGIYFVEQSATLREMKELQSGNLSLSDYWFFLGFSSWGRGKLFDEIADGAWNVSNNDTEHLDWPWTLSL